MAKKPKVPKRRSFEAMSLRVHTPKVIPDKRKNPKPKKFNKRDWDSE